MDSSYPTAGNAVREPAVMNSLNRVAKQVEEVDSLCCVIEKRVAMVSAPVGPAAPREPEKKPGCGVPLALQLDGIYERLQQISRRLRDQIDRIELPSA